MSALAERYPRVEDFLDAVEEVCGPDSWFPRPGDGARAFAACPACRSELLPSPHVSVRFPLGVAISGSSWSLFAVTCDCGEETILRALDGADVRAERMPGGLVFRTPGEQRARVEVAEEEVWEGYLRRGAVTLVSSLPKVGKTTLVRAVTVAVASSATTFLERAVTSGSVVYTSEESARTFAASLPDLTALRVLVREDTWPKPSWEVLLAAIRQEVRRTEAVLAVIDTFPWFAGFAEQGENDSALGTAKIAELASLAAAENVAALLVHHERKAGGEGGVAVRGGGGIVGAVDAVVEVKRVEGDRNRRRLVGLGRWEIPTLVYDHDPSAGSWRVVGEGESGEVAASAAWQDQLLAALAGSPSSTYADIERLLDGAPKARWLNALNDLLADGRVIREGEGKKGSPRRFTLAPADSIPASHTPARMGSAPAAGGGVSVMPSAPRRGPASEPAPALGPEKPNEPTDGNGRAASTARLLTSREFAGRLAADLAAVEVDPSTSLDATAGCGRRAHAARRWERNGLRICAVCHPDPRPGRLLACLRPDGPLARASTQVSPPFSAGLLAEFSRIPIGEVEEALTDLLAAGEVERVGGRWRLPVRSEAA